MKKIICLALLALSITSFGWQKTSAGLIEMSSSEKAQIFGSERYCADLGFNYINSFLLEDGKIRVNNPEEIYGEYASNITRIGKNLQKELSGLGEIDEYAASIYYYVLNCKVPSNTIRNQWGSNTFNQIMTEVEKLREQIF